MSVDVIVVGARVAGAATGMLLARAGLRVLVVDQHTSQRHAVPHQIQLPGVARLARFGLRSRLDAGRATTPTCVLAGGAVVEGSFRRTRAPTW
jgi:2-polyprenyl-6-methoxyphenol hydroxylase-like FAD-dependent oxidoreductase